MNHEDTKTQRVREEAGDVSASETAGGIYDLLEQWRKEIEARFTKWEIAYLHSEELLHRAVVGPSQSLAAGIDIEGAALLERGRSLKKIGRQVARNRRAWRLIAKLDDALARGLHGEAAPKRRRRKRKAVR